MSGVITADVSYLAGASSNPNPDPNPNQVRVSYLAGLRCLLEIVLS